VSHPNVLTPARPILFPQRQRRQRRAAPGGGASVFASNRRARPSRR
jgi:hypothetical protein